MLAAEVAEYKALNKLRHTATYPVGRKGGELVAQRIATQKANSELLRQRTLQGRLLIRADGKVRVVWHELMWHLHLDEAAPIGSRTTVGIVIAGGRPERFHTLNIC